MGNKCIVSVKNKEEMDAVEKNHHFMVKTYHSHECPHCKQMLPIIEEKCKEIKAASPTEDLVAFVDCPVNNKFCKDEAVALGAKGIPFIAGSPRGQKPVFTVEGAKPNELNEHVVTLKKLIDQSKQVAEMAGKNGPKEIEEETSSYNYDPPPSYPQATPPGGITNGRMKFGYDNAPRSGIVPLCTPGVTCSQDDYNARIAKFISRKNSKREVPDF